MTSMLKRFSGSQSGTVSIMVALLLPVLLGFAALVSEFGHGLVVRAENQRIADLAAFAGATTYASSGASDSAGKEAEMNQAVARIATLNGIDPADATASLIASPRGNGAQAVSVRVSTNKTLILAPVLGDHAGLTIVANAAAEVSANATPGCVIALDAAQTGITLSGGTKINAPECTVASNSTITVPCGTKIDAKAITYNSVKSPNDPCKGITPQDAIAKAEATDPLVGDPSIAAATSRLPDLTAMTAPTLPAIPNSTNDIDFGWDFGATSSTKKAATNAGCDANGSSGVWTLTCSSSGPHNFRNLTAGGGIRVNFNTAGSASKIYNFSGRINFNGASIEFGPGTYNIAQGITTGGGTTTTFAAGTYNIGASTASCDGATYSICHTGTSLSFAGPSNFNLTSGIFNASTTLTLGNGGTTNTYQIGAASNGNAILVGNGAKTSLRDAQGSTVKLTGNITTNGGSCLILPAANNIDLKGYLTSAGGHIFGAGIYTITGYMALGAEYGGDEDCTDANGVTSRIGLYAKDVTIVIGGASLPSSWACSGQAFCIGAGYKTVIITSPDSKLAVIGPTSSGTAGATFTSGAINSRISGVLYFPRGPILMSGGAGLSGADEGCLQIIGSRIDLSGGTAAASACVSDSAAGSGTVMLVQ